MKYIHYIFMYVLLMQVMLVQSAHIRPVSRCESWMMQCDIFIANCCGYTEQDVLVDAAHLQNPRRLEICLALEIGSLQKKDFQGHTPLSAAQLMGAEENIQIIKGCINKKYGNQSPISVTDRKIFKPKIN